MKKLHSAVILFALLFLIILCTNCNNDPEAPSVLQLVSSSGQNYVFENRNVAGGTPVITGVYAQAPTDNVSLSRFVVTFNHDSLDKKPPVVFLDSTLAPDTKTFAMPVAYTPRNLANTEIWKFIVTDSEGKTYQRVVRIKTTTTVNTAESAFYTYTNVLLSRLKKPENNLLDSTGLISFSSAYGTAFPAYAAKQPAIASSIDLTLNNAASQKPNLSLEGSDSLVLTNLIPADFDALNNVNAIKEAYPKNTPGVTKLENLKIDRVLAFKSVSNKIGLLRIKAVYKTLDSLAFDVKVEK